MESMDKGENQNSCCGPGSESLNTDNQKGGVACCDPVASVSGKTSILKKILFAAIMIAALGVILHALFGK